MGPGRLVHSGRGHCHSFPFRLSLPFQIIGISKKGKEFFKFNTQVSFGREGDPPLGQRGVRIRQVEDGTREAAVIRIPPLRYPHTLICNAGALRPPPPPPSPQVTESITKVDVADRDIWSSAEYVHNQYEEGRDKAFYLCPDRINHAEVRGGGAGRAQDGRLGEVERREGFHQARETREIQDFLL